MIDIDLDAMYREAKKAVRLSCDENHQHSAIQNCLSGDLNAINVCKLWEYIQGVRSAFTAFNSMLEGPLK